MECLPEKVAIKVITCCGTVPPSSIRRALRKHLLRLPSPVPTSEVLVKVLESTGNFVFKDGRLFLTEKSMAKPALNRSEKVFLRLFQDEGPILPFESIYHSVLEADLSAASVISLLTYSPLVHRVEFGLYTLVGSFYDNIDIEIAKSRVTKVSSNYTMRPRVDGIIEFETNVGLWMIYSGTLYAGPAKRMKGRWKISHASPREDELVIDKTFISGMKYVSEELGIVAGDRIRIEFDTNARQVEITKITE